MKKNKRILLTFVGTNDAGKLKNKDDGAILTALTNQQFDEVFLLWNKSGNKENDYLLISKYLEQEIKLRKLAKRSTIVELPISNVTDHNQIYIALKQFTDDLNKSLNIKYTAAISSGTPAMQVCWILLSESGDFSETNKLDLIQVKDPKFGMSANIPVQIDTALPKIIRLKAEVEILKKDLIPNANISINKPRLTIGDIEIKLPPMGITYYYYFAERVINGMGDEKFTGYNTTDAFLKSIISIHEKLFPYLDSYRMELENILKKGMGLSLSTFRSNISKLNTKIEETLKNDTISSTFKISNDGVRGAMYYGIKSPQNKMSILK